MAHKYLLTVSEMRLILSILEIPFLNGFEQFPAYREDDKADALTAAVSLEDKELLKNRYTEYPSLDNDLAMFFHIAAMASGRYTISREDSEKTNRSIYYFENDSILLFQIIDKDVSILWIPFIYMAIGGAVSILGPYLNRETDSSWAVSFNDYPEALQYCADRGYRVQTVFLRQDRGGDEEVSGYTFTNGQILLFLEKKSDRFYLTCPGEADYINAVGQHLVLLHGSAMKREEA